MTDKTTIPDSRPSRSTHQPDALTQGAGGRSVRAQGDAVGPLSDRIIAQHDQNLPGPLLVVLGGLHGNEPAGLLAIEEVSARLGERLQRGEVQLAGRVVFLSGNRAALARGSRFIDTDLNRMWTAERIERVRTQPPEADLSEERELRELLEVLEFELLEAPGEAVLLDLHSTSAGGAPFAIIGDTLRNRSMTDVLPIPTLLGLEERIDGPLLSWFADMGHTAIVVEGGQNQARTTLDHHVAAIWLTLIAAGSLSRAQVPEARASHALLARVARGLPALIEVEAAHPIRLGDGFQMLPRFDSFQEVRAGQPLAHDLKGVIRAGLSGHILMPLYQGQGEDGFFLGRQISASWLRFSRWLRRSRLEALLSQLPGLAPHPHSSGTLIKTVPELRPLVRSFLRLFGYRKERTRDGQILFEQRRQ